jgi:hypothetical protein
MGKNGKAVICVSTVRIRVRVALGCTECTENCRKKRSSKGSVSN